MRLYDMINAINCGNHCKLESHSEALSLVLTQGKGQSSEVGTAMHKRKKNKQTVYVGLVRICTKVFDVLMLVLMLAFPVDWG